MTKPRSPKAAPRPAAEAVAALPATVDPASAPVAERRPRKREIVLALLRRAEGVSTAELMAATGWQAHTVRAALSMLRRDGEVITRTGRAATMRYHLKEPRP